MKPKSINALMKYMRDEKNININGSEQKKALRHMGYFHGYKGYRFCRNPSNTLDYKNFKELEAVYYFDMKLKELFYPKIMFLETALKNYVLEIILSESESDSFAKTYDKLLTGYKYASKSEKNKAFEKRLRLRNNIYNEIAKNYRKRLVVNHYYDNDKYVPLWAIFELIALGEFGHFISCLNLNIKEKISNDIGIHPGFDQDGRMTEIIVYTLKDIRNSIAHNNTVFDVRFKTFNISSRLSKYISTDLGIKDISFHTITDYIILVAFLMNKFKCSKKEIFEFIKGFENCCETLRGKVPISIYSKIIFTNTKGKLDDLKKILGK